MDAVRHQNLLRLTPVLKLTANKLELSRLFEQKRYQIRFEHKFKKIVGNVGKFEHLGLFFKIHRHQSLMLFTQKQKVLLLQGVIEV